MSESYKKTVLTKIGYFPLLHNSLIIKILNPNGFKYIIWSVTFMRLWKKINIVFPKKYMLKKKYSIMKSLLLIISLFVCVSMSIIANTTNSRTTEDIYWKAVKLYSEENYTKALLYFKHALDQNPTDSELNYYVGMCFHHLNKPKLASAYLSKAAGDRLMKLKIQLMTKNNLEEINYYSGY
jgi:energy-coupling factor transporter transmembrane protein EcfT